jgi:hypothetical protein
MPKYQITRSKPSPGMGETQLEKSVVEVPAGYPVPMGGILVPDSTPVSAFANASSAPELPAHEARTPVSEEEN